VKDIQVGQNTPTLVVELTFWEISTAPFVVNGDFE
jgi:hypothetical protein